MVSGAWLIVGTLAAGASAVFAGVQILLSRRDANRRAVLDLLQTVDQAGQEVLPHNIAEAQAGSLAVYRGTDTEFSEGARAYLAFLNTLDLVAFSVNNGLADRKLVVKHVSTLLRAEAVTVAFIRSLQGATDDERTYEDLLDLIEKQPFRGRLPRISPPAEGSPT